MTFGLTPFGFNSKRLSDIKQDLENAMTAQFGEVNLDPQSVFGQLIGVLSKAYADLWDNMQDVYYSQYPNSASGMYLDNVVQFNGLTRLPALQSTVNVVCTGNNLTTIPAGSLVQIPNTNVILSNPIAGLIITSSAYSVNVTVTALLNQAYTIVMNNVQFIYSIPIITFTGDFDPLGTTIVYINGVPLAGVPWNTDQETTINDVAAQIATNVNVLSATAISFHDIKIIPNVGFNANVTNITFGAGSPPTWAQTFATPDSIAAIVSNLVANLNSGTPAWLAIGDSPVITITALSTAEPFSIVSMLSLSLSALSSPVAFVCQQYGPIGIPADSVTQILTPVSGLSSINNPEAGITGRLIETDSELRIRRNASIQLLGNGTVEAIRARILQDVPGVTSVTVLENQTLTQNEIDIVFNAALITGNIIAITLNTRALTPITWATSNTATMTQLALILAAQPEVFSASVGGTGNNTLIIRMNVLAFVTINSVAVTGGASQAGSVTVGGQIAKSFQCIVQGGDNLDVAEEIWLSKPAGIATFGNTQQNIIDSQGNAQLINFSRPTPIYIWVTVALTLSDSSIFPSNGISITSQNILNFGDGLNSGVDVFFQQVLCSIFNSNCPGVGSGVMTIAATTLATGTPSYGTSNIVITSSQIAVFDLTRIFVTVV